MFSKRVLRQGRDLTGHDELTPVLREDRGDAFDRPVHFLSRDHKRR
jgi:hypothetical protein